MKNYQIYNAYPALMKLADLQYNDYDVNLNIALMLQDVESRYKIITSMIGKLNMEYCVANEDGRIVLHDGNPAMKQGKTMAEYNAELQKISDSDANYNPEKIVIYRNSLRDGLPNPREILQLRDFVTFVKEDK